MIKIVLLGTGNVATHLYNAFHTNHKTKVVQVYNRSKKRLLYFEEHSTTTTTSISKITEHADVYIVAISDDSINEFTKKLRFHNKLVVHTSGSVGMMSIANQNKRGVFYPLQTFTLGKKVDFTQIPICIETEFPENLPVLEQLANAISNHCYHISSEQRKALHIAAVFVNNFANHMYQKGAEICREHKLPFDILKPLIQETARKIETLSPEKSQTGPAIRNDKETISRHLTDLTDKTQQEIYKILTKSIQKTHGKS